MTFHGDSFVLTAILALSCFLSLFLIYVYNYLLEVKHFSKFFEILISLYKSLLKQVVYYHLLRLNK